MSVYQAVIKYIMDHNKNGLPMGYFHDIAENFIKFLIRNVRIEMSEEVLIQKMNQINFKGHLECFIKEMSDYLTDENWEKSEDV